MTGNYKDSKPATGSSDKLTVNIQPIPVMLMDKNALYNAYMPFAQNGGVFVRSTVQYKMGDRVSLALQLMDPRDRYLVYGRVVWITPAGAQAGMAVGMGVQFEEDTPKEIRNKIDTYLAGSTQSDRRTDTM